MECYRIAESGALIRGNLGLGSESKPDLVIYVPPR